MKNEIIWEIDSNKMKQYKLNQEQLFMIYRLRGIEPKRVFEILDNEPNLTIKTTAIDMVLGVLDKVAPRPVVAVGIVKGK